VGEGQGAFMAGVERASMTHLEGADYRRIEEERGCHLMGGNEEDAVWSSE
jgi:hypothetical protein